MVEMPRPEQFRQTMDGAAPASPAGATPNAVAAPTSRWRRSRRLLIAAALLAGTVGSGHYGHDYWTTGRFMVETDDAYVRADSTIVAPKVSGYIVEVDVRDNQPVKTGDVLARIDDRDFRAGVDQAHADVASAKAAVRNLDAEIALHQAEIDQARAAVASTKASLNFAEGDADRYRSLAQSGAGTTQRAEQTRAQRDQLVAQIMRDKATLVASERRTAVLAAARDQAFAQADRAQATARQAELNLGYTAIVAAVDGTVGARSLRVGQYVTAGTQLMAVVPLDAAYVVANYKETQLSRVRAGQPVEVRIDGLPGLRLSAHVDSVSPASGLEFALLPPDNATGNFTKIVQRIPVRIAIDDRRAAGLLRAGMSVEPAVDTRSLTSVD
jgi:membrane fusion protein (multidrug efflux system)